MKADVFDNGLRRLRVNMGKPPIPPDDRDIYYDELSWIPDAAWPDIVSVAIDRWESWPRNFAKAVKALWHEWQSRRKATFEPSECKYCDGEGLLRQDKDGYEMTYPCGHCDNWQQHFGGSLEWKQDHKTLVIKRLRIDDVPF
jgi:hypothetical protein